MRQEDFPVELSYQRSKKGFTQRKLAQILEVSDRSVKLWESGSALPRKGVRIRMAQAFDLPLTYFLLPDELPGATVARTEPDAKEQEKKKLYDQLQVTLLELDVSEDIKKTLSQAIKTGIEKAYEM